MAKIQIPVADLTDKQLGEAREGGYWADSVIGLTPAQSQRLTEIEAEMDRRDAISKNRPWNRKD